MKHSVIGLLLITILLFVGALLSTRFYQFSDIKSAQDCMTRAKLPQDCQQDPNCCAIWDNNMCWKAKLDPDSKLCTKHVLAIPLLLLVLSCVFAILFISALILKI